MNNRVVPLFVAASLLFTQMTKAADEEEKGPLSVDAEVGALLTHGNTQSASFKGKVDINHELEQWRNNFVAEGLYKRDEVTNTVDGVETKEDKKTAEKYFFSAQADYKLNEEYRGIFGYISYEEDKFSGYQYQGTVAFGYSDRLFGTEKQNLDFSIGPGMAYSRTEAGYDDDDVWQEADNDEAFILRCSGKYVFRFNKSTKFTQLLASDIALNSDKNTKTRAETAITTALNSSFALKAAFTYQNNSVVASESIEKTDTQTTVTLVYTY